MPIVLNAANEIAVDAFLKGRIGFADIARFVEKAMERHSRAGFSTNIPAGLEDIMALDRETRQVVSGSL